MTTHGIPISSQDDIQSNAIALNTSKVGITTARANVINNNSTSIASLQNFQTTTNTDVGNLVNLIEFDGNGDTKIKTNTAKKIYFTMLQINYLIVSK